MKLVSKILCGVGIAIAGFTTGVVVSEIQKSNMESVAKNKSEKSEDKTTANATA